MREIRIAAWPFEGQTNAYIDLFYRALEGAGVRFVRGLRWDDAFLREQGRSLDAIHIQWAPEQIWRTRGTTTLARLRGVAGLWRFLRLAKRMNLRILWTVHDFPHPEGARFVDWCGYRVLAACADLRICHSNIVRAELIKRYGRPDDTVAIPFGNYHGALPSPRPKAVTLNELGLRTDRKTLVCQGLVRPYKGFDLAIDAMRSLGPDYQLIVAGPAVMPGLDAALKAKAAGLSNVRLLLERLDDQMVADVLHAADCVLFPYRWITGSSALLAALTMGRGVITSDLPFFTEALAPAPEAGVQFMSENVPSLTSAIVDFFNSPAERRRRAVDDLTRLYSWDRVIEPVATWLTREFQTSSLPAGDARMNIAAAMESSK